MRTLLPLLAAAVLTATLVQPAAAAEQPHLEPRADQRFRRGRRGAGRGRAHRPAHGVPRSPRGRRGGGHPGHGRRAPACSPSTRTGSTSPTNRSPPASRPGSPRGPRPTSTSAACAPAATGPSGSRPTDGVPPCSPSPSSTSRPASSSPATPARRPPGSTLTALATVQVEGARAEGNPLSYKIFATREGLVGGTTANGHVITPHDRFVALPSRRALSPNGSSDYSVRICAPNGRCAFAPVWDVGPWNIKDDYWNAGPRAVARPPAGHPAGPGRLPQGLQRRQGRVRPQGRQPGGHRPRRRHLLGRPRADQQHHGHGRLPVDRQRPAGEGGRHRPGVRRPRQGRRRRGHGRAASAGVPVECVTDGWLRIGVGQFLPAAAVKVPSTIARCESAAGSR